MSSSSSSIANYWRDERRSTCAGGARSISNRGDIGPSTRYTVLGTRYSVLGTRQFLSELVKKWGLAPAILCSTREISIRGRCLSPFFHKLSRLQVLAKEKVKNRRPAYKPGFVPRRGERRPFL